MKKYIWLISAIFISAAVSASEKDLKSEILEMDKKLFDAFNTRDLETTKAIFDTNLEFYHDAAGLAGYDQTIENTRRLFEKAGDLKRKLIVKTVEVYPIKDYGAIQTGQHQFCHTENKKLDCGTFKFLHVWKKTDNSWKLARVVSYGHKKY